MARVVNYDLSNATPQDNAPVPPGLYTVVIEEIVAGDSKSSGAPMLTVTFKITKGDHKGRKFWYYIMLDGSTDGRFREFVDALNLGAKGKLDLDHVKGMVCQVKTSIEKGTDGYDDKGRVKNVLPADGASSGDEDEEELPPYPEWETAELREEVEARNLTIPGKKTKAALIRALEADDAASAPDEDEEGDEDEEEDLTLAELEEMDRAALKALIKTNELEIKVLKSDTDEALREKIAEALEISGDEDEEDEEEEEESDEEEEEEGLSELEGLDRDGLKKYIKDNDVEVKVLTKDTVETLRSKIADALGWDEDEEEEEEEEESDEEEVEPYDKWEIADLKTELKERGLKTDGRKTILVKRLEQDDAKDGEPF
jgi:SAP domain/Protein of unknown function (DUF669)